MVAAASASAFAFVLGSPGLSEAVGDDPAGSDVPTCHGRTATIHVGPEAAVEFVYGTEGNDVIVVESLTVPERNRVHGIFAGGGDDFVCAVGPRRFAVEGGGGNDTISTGHGNDHVQGGPGRDKMRTGFGEDFIDGGRFGNFTDQADGGPGGLDFCRRVIVRLNCVGG